MPSLPEPEYDALKASIAAGYDPARPIVVDENGAVLDGHHRQQVCAELGITPPTVTLPGLTEDQKHDYAMRANLACRHLTQLQKRELIRAELDRGPGRSDREIGRLCGVDHKTVGSVRRGEIPHSETGPDPEDIALIEELTTQIQAEIAKARGHLYVALLSGFPAAEAAGILITDWYKRSSTREAEALRIAHDAMLVPCLEALAAWPGGAFADELLARDDELKDIYTERLAAGVLS
jgi:ParB-like chromosome segregation protein Spo0J